MEIVPPKDFKDGRSLRSKFTRYDPRKHFFPSPDVIINLSECSRIRLPAMLWCVVNLMLWKEREWSCSLFLPTAADAAGPLIDTGLAHLLQSEGIPSYGDKTDSLGSSQVILPLTRFDSLSEAADLTNHVEDTLYGAGLGSANIHPIVCELFSELANNAAEHSESSIGAYGLIQFSTSGPERRFELCIADGGIGIAKSLEGNPRLTHAVYEWTALELAVKELVSGTSSTTRGIGLFSVFEESHVPGRELTIHTGNAILTISQRSEIRMTRANLFPGTLVYLSVPA